jgi:predicted PurR-regulated permease PerM
MTNFFVFLLFAGIGSIFGPVGFFIGLILGIFGWIGAAIRKLNLNPSSKKRSPDLYRN